MKNTIEKNLKTIIITICVCTLASIIIRHNITLLSVIRTVIASGIGAVLGVVIIEYISKKQDSDN